MPITTSLVGRAKLIHPDLGFDNNDGGTLLHAKIATMWTAVSDHLPSRFSGPNTLASAATFNIIHNFGLAIGKLKFIFFEAGSQLTEAQFAAKYTKTQISTNEIQITNITGGSLTFSVIILAFRLGTTNDDTDPSFAAMWDTVNGEAFKTNLYKSTTFTHSTANEYYDMYIDGDLILGANLIVHGNLFVTGQIQTAGITAFQLTVKKNVYTGNGANFSSSGNFDVGGDLLSLATFSCHNSTSPTAFSAIIGGDVFIQGDLNLNGFNATTGVDNPLPGFTTNIYGNVVCGGLYTTGTREGATDSLGANGGSIRIYGNLTASDTVDSEGDSGLGVFSGGNGGFVVIGGNAVIAGTGIFTTGGTSGGGGSSQPGSSGLIAISGDVIRHKDFFTSNVRLLTFGKNSSTADINGANGADITIGGDCHAGITSFGGNGLGTGQGGNGGAITIHGNLIGNSSTPLTLDNHGSSGGGGGAGSSGGTAGIVQILGGVFHFEGGLECFGGNGSGTGTGGDGAQVVIFGDVVDTLIDAYGGNVSAGTGAGLGGAGGLVTIHGEFLGKIRVIDTHGGNQTGTATGRAGSGGNVTCKANMQCTTVITSAGTQPVTSVNAGSGGNLTVNGDFKGDFTSIGSSAVSATSVNGGNSGALDVGGSFNGIITSTGGNGLTGGGKTGNIAITRDLKGSATLVAGNAVATSGAATGGNIGTGSASPILVGGDVNVTTLSCTPGNATNAGLTTGVGGGYGGVTTNAITVRGDLSSSGVVSFKGGDGKTSGANSSEVRIYGKVAIFGQLNVSGGSATNGTGQAGKVSDFHLAGGGFIDEFFASPSSGIANAGISSVFLMGYLTIRSWNVSLTYYPATQFLEKLNSAILAAGSMSAMVMITTRTADGGTDGTDALNDVFPRTGTAAQAAMQGRYNGANTVWKYRTFNNT